MQISAATQAQMEHRPLDDIRYFVVHHSVASQTLDISQIAIMEEQAQSFVTVGYHAYARLNPTTGRWEIQEGRTIDDVPAAAYGLNEPSYDLCVAGNYQPNVAGVPTNPVPYAALDLVVARVGAVRAKCPNLTYLIGHSDVARIMGRRGNDPANYATACPGSLLYACLHDLRVRTGLTLPPELA